MNAAPVARRRLALNILFGSLSSAAQRLVSSAVALYLARVLGPAGFGAISLATAFASYCGIFVSWGTDIAGMRQVSRHPGRCRELFARYSGNRLVFLVFSAPLAAAYVLLVMPAGTERLLAGIALLQLAGVALSPVFILTGLERLDVLAAVNVAALVLPAVLAPLAVRGPRDYWGGLAVTLLPGLLLTGFGAVALARMGRFAWPVARLRAWRRHLIEGWPIVVVWLASGASLNADFFVAARLSSAELGLYAVAWKVRTVLLTGNAIIQSAFMPRLAALGPQPAVRKKLHSGLLFLEGSVAVCLAGLLIAISGPCLEFALGSRYQGASGVLNVLAVHTAVIYVFQSAINPLTVSGRAGLAAKLYVVNGLAAAAGALAGGQWGTAHAIAAGTLAGESVGVLFAIWVLRRTEQAFDPAILATLLRMGTVVGVAIYCSGVLFAPRSGTGAVWSFLIVAAAVLFTATLWDRNRLRLLWLDLKASR